MHLDVIREVSRIGRAVSANGVGTLFLVGRTGAKAQGFERTYFPPHSLELEKGKLKTFS